MKTTGPLSAFLAPFCAIVACVACGCQTTALRVSTTAQAHSVTDFYYDQILENMAYLCDNPGGLPTFSAAGNAQTAIADTFTGADQLGWDVFSAGTGLVGHLLFDKQYATLTGSRASTQTWLTSTTPDPDRLELMRCAYLSALGSPSKECHDKLCLFYGDDKVPWQALRPGWFFVCNRGEVPKKLACRVGYCGTKAVWVPASNLNALSDFTKVILNMASSLGTGSRLDTQIQTLRAQAKDLGDILKTRTSLTKEAADASNASGQKRIPVDTDPRLDKLNSVGTEELRRAYAEALVQLELAMLNKKIADTKSEVLRQYLCNRRKALLECDSVQPTMMNRVNGESCVPLAEPTSQPVLSPRLQLNQAPYILISP